MTNFENVPQGVVLNHVLWKLAEALGYVTDDDEDFVVENVEDLVNEAVETIWRYQELYNL